METSNNDETEEKENKDEIIPNVDSPPPSEPNTPSKSPEDTSSKPKKGKAIGYVSDSDEELPMGLLERPVVIESGKRERKKTDRLPVGEGFGSGQKKKIDIPEGKGEKLGNIAIIEFRINQHKAEDLKVFHRILFSRTGTANEIKKNIRLFNGFPFEVDDKEYTKRMSVLNKATLPQIKLMCAVLDIERKGTKVEIVNRLMNFLMKPTDSGKAVPKPKKKKSRTSGEKRKRTKKESKAKSKEDVSDDEDDDDDVKDTTLEDDDSSQEDNVDGDDSESEKEEAKPPKKKRRTESPKPQKTKSEKPKAEKTKAEKPKAKPKKEKKEKENGKKEKSKSKVTKDSDDSSDDEPLSKSISDPPGNDEIKKVIEKILDGADLEEVTMKTVVKQVYAKYPKFDLSDKKEFIKCTVKEIISFND
ncbi:hypothetical protein LOTGIDRAFT_152179 [Lottia gigantea]|uniref:DEK-C domain-containing protein n=1 Tax=Lottia gigantea TaxID=225164 RepID=V4B4F3_LOTGI|nr:hypothetical protein LOTGIDRAFT_152179 [Lottia gigantea]ESP05338.1 hypothetical protein LOTGIDRAFT_152179 [Lottia gigantea]